MNPGVLYSVKKFVNCPISSQRNSVGAVRPYVFKVKLCVYPPLKHVLGEGVWHHSFLNSELGGCEWSASHPGRFISGEKTG